MLRSRLARQAQIRKTLVDQQSADAAAANPHDDDDRSVPASREVVQETSQISSVFQRNFNRPPFDIHDPGKSVSRHLLLPVQKSGLVSCLYREKGQVSSAMVVQMGAYFNIRLNSADVEAVLESADPLIRGSPGHFSEKFRRKIDDADSEPEPEPEPDEPAATKNEPIGFSSGFSYEQFYGLVWLLKKELHALYRDVMKRENDLKAEEESVSKRLDVPSYTQQRGIADSLADFNRMSRIRLFGTRNTHFGGESISLSSVILSFPTMSITSESRIDDERSSISAASHSTMIESESGRSAAHTPFFVPAKPTAYHPLKNPDVFRHFYPSVVSDETKKLPIFAQFEKIMSMLATRRVSVISGKTGTGKTTQVPLMVLDQCASDNRPCNIIVTQPRRLAAMGVARRVCADRHWTLGQLVGYHVGLDKRTSQSTRLTYCTTGVFIEKIVSEKHLNNYSHVFLDEVHERDQDTDMALMLVRQMLRENSPDVKVILMSATVEVNKMTRYFGHNMDSFAMEDQLGRVTVDTSSHEIYEKFLDEFAERSESFDFDVNKPRLSHDLLALAAYTLDNLEPVSHNEKLHNDPLNPPNQAVLVFLPGLEHINELAEMIKARGSELELMVLHSTVSGTDQEKVLDPPAPGVRRVILSTNIAESSLTIPYIDYVFDFCLTKVMRLNSRTKVPQLSLEWASVANCQQRKGRVGRVRKGRVYFFVPRKFFTEAMPRHPEPEVLIAPIEHSVLRVKLLNVAPPPAEVLVLLLDPPKRNDVEIAILTLKEIGALTVKFHGQPSYADGDLTTMGKMLSRFPMDVRMAKFLVLCCIFGYVQEGVTIASGLTIDSVISTQNLRSVDRCKLLHDLYSSHGVKSDALAVLYAFERWNAECSKGTFRSRIDEQRWCQSQLIDVARMKEFLALRREVWYRLNQRGLLLDVVTVPQSVPRETIIPLLLAGAFYPNILVNQNTINDVAVGKNLLGYNPLHTCVIPKFGYATACSAPLYDTQIKNTLKLNTDGDSVARIIYGSHETYICFSRHSGNIAHFSDSATNLHRGVELLKKRMEVMRGTLALRDQLDSEDLRMSTACFDVINSDVDTRFCVRDSCIRLPPPDIHLEPGKRVPIAVADVENVELFWLAHWDEVNQRRQLDMNKATTEMASRNALRSVRHQDIVLFSSYLSRHRDSDVEFARVTVVGPPDKDGNVQVLLVDCGIIDRIPTSWLFVLPECTRDVPRACFEFIFSGLRFVASKKTAAAEYIKQCVAVEETELSLEVHSVIDGVVHGIIFWKSHFLNGETINLNEEMVKLGYAFSGSESWIAEYDHRRRLNGPVTPLPSTYDVPQKDVPRTEQLLNLVHVGPIQFPARVNMQTIGRHRVSVVIESGSLNGFSFDRNPEDKCWPYRPLVATRLVHSGNRDRLKGHSTTVLPIQPGLMGIVAAAFGPYVEIIMAEGEFVGALSGLGPFPGKSHTFYPDCEVELPFDAEMKPDDFTKINQLRSKMNTVLERISDEASDRCITENLQESCVHILMDLLNRPRRVRSLRGTSAIYKWTKTEHDLTNDAAAATFLVAVEFSPLPEELSEDLYDNIVALHNNAKRLILKKSSSNTQITESRCSLCNAQLGNADLLLAHLYGEEHQAKERLFLGMKENMAE